MPRSSSISAFVGSVVATALFAISLFPVTTQAGVRETKRIDQGKITKNEAQHLALKKFPGATVKKCELTKGADHSIWAIDLQKSGAHDLTHLQVDGLTGKITP